MKSHTDYWTAQETPERADAMADEFLERAKGKHEAQQHEMARQRELIAELSLTLADAKAQLEYLQWKLKTASGQATLRRIDAMLAKLRSRP